MSNLTNYGENILADFIRGQGLPTITQFYVALASAASDSAITELSGTGYARQPYGRGLTQWSGTQGPATTLASNGTSHSTSNNNSISFGTPGGSWGTASFIVLYDALTGGNALAFVALDTPLAISGGTPVSFSAGSIPFSLGLAGGISNYFSNKLIDLFFRGQAYTMPTSGFMGLFTTAPTDAGGGVEVAGGGYARQSFGFSLLGLSGTQAAGTTVASTGTSGVISLNLPLAFPAPTANWGTITHEAVFDASGGAGNLLMWNPLDQSRTVLAGSSPQTHAAGSWSITVA